ncbi:MAG TPA: c-type cytochrome [Methylophaga aminisulfidivorans]|uniref:C-type cytochrome n=2 Tax=root TaxID=1 RepID=A0A7C1VS35_9GAMM|nr:c-type cytochrome [Methylophaga aminisulfidivorans]
MTRQCLLLLVGLVLSGLVQADGQRLHDAACIQCHRSLGGGDPYQLYTRTDRKVDSLATLTKRVASCSLAADVEWSDAQKKDVVMYLNRQFYHFK